MIKILQILGERNLLIPLVIAVFLGTTLVVVVPLISNLLFQQEEIGRLEKEVNALSTKRDRLQNLNSEQINEGVKMATKALPAKAAVLPIISFVRSAAAQSGLVIIQLRVARENLGKDQSVSGAASSGITVELEGPVADIQQFLGNVRRVLPIIEVGRGKLTTRGGVTQVTVTLNTFWKKLPEQLSGVSAPLPQLTPNEEKLLSSIKQLGSGEITQTIVPSQTSTAPRLNPFAF